MSECFPTGYILLISVGEGDVNPSLHVMQGTLCGGSMLDVCIAKGGVAEVGGLAAATVEGRRERVFAQITEEEEAKDTEVHDGLGLAWFWMFLESLFQGSENGNVDRPDLRGSWVIIVSGLV